MELGEKLRQARLAAGLSQRALCGDTITRNMLSQIENGNAKPSMATLQFLSRGLGLPVSYFLDEEAETSSNASCMEAAWAAFEAGETEKTAEILDSFRMPDPILERDCRLLRNLVLLDQAQTAIAENRTVYARELLSRAAELEGSWLPELRRRRILLQTQLGDQADLTVFSDTDEILGLRARAAVKAGQPARAALILDACDDRESPKWCLLRGQTAMELQEYDIAAAYLRKAESFDPKTVIPLLEICFRELGDYQSAYYYACKGRE